MILFWSCSGRVVSRFGFFNVAIFHFDELQAQTECDGDARGF